MWRIGWDYLLAESRSYAVLDLSQVNASANGSGQS
jgi:hypothetical protein